MKSPIIASLLFSTALIYAESDYFQQLADDPNQRAWQTGPQELPPLADITARPGQARPVYGVYLWASEYEVAHEEIEKMGVRSVRMAGPAIGFPDAFLTAAKNDLEIMYTVANGTMRERKKGTRWNRAAYDSDEAYLAALTDTYNKFLDEFGPNGSLYEGTDVVSPVKFIEVLNEPNYQYMIPDREPRAEVEAEREALYAKVLPAMSQVIREHPNALPIVGFGAGGGGATAADYRFVEGVFEDGGQEIQDTYDIFSTHPYMDGAPPEVFKIKRWGPISMANNLHRMQALLLKEGGSEKPVWFTEVGWEIGHEFGGHFEDNAKSKSIVITPELHGAYIARTFLWAMRLGVERVHVMHMHDTDRFNSGLMHRGSLEWRPAAYAIKNMTTRLPNPKLSGAQSDGEGDNYIYEFISDHTQDDQMDMIVAWNVVGPAEVEIPVSGDVVTVYDLVGNEKTLPVQHGILSLEIGPYPIYIAQ